MGKFNARIVPELQGDNKVDDGAKYGIVVVMTIIV